MKKKDLIFYLALVIFIFFGVRTIFKPDQAAAPSLQIPANTESVVATVPKIEQKKEPVESAAATSSTVIEIDNQPSEIAKTSAIIATSTILLNVDFTSQAPLAEWSDLRQQDGCEEASALMAVRWAKGLGALTKAEAKKEILAISTFEENNYGNYIDTSIADTLKIIIQEYFGYQKAILKKNSSLEEIKDELNNGNVLILPLDGKKLKNPNFKNGGPERHNLVIRGYDPVTHEFITNDPGTRKGDGYRYPEKIIDAAWRDYPTGDHLPIAGVKKNMIVVQAAKD